MYSPSLFKHLSHLSKSFWMPDAKNDAGCCPSHWRMTDSTSVTDVNFCPPSIFSLAQKDDSHWGPSPNCRAGVVMCLTSVVPQSPVRHAMCSRHDITDDVTIMTSSSKILCMFKIKFPTNRIYWIFPISRINEMAPFLTYLLNNPGIKWWVKVNNEGRQLLHWDAVRSS